MRRVFILLACAAAACATGERPPITVGGRSMSREELAAILQPVDPSSVDAYAEAIRDRLLILEDATARGLDTLPETRSLLWDAGRERLTYAWLFEQMCGVTVPDASVQAFWDSMGTVVEYTAVQVEDSARAESLRVLAAGGADPSLLAVSNTVLREDLPDSGRIGPTDLMLLQPTDRELLRGLAGGGVSAVVEIPSGWRFLVLDTLFEVEKQPLAQADSMIRARLWAVMSEERKLFLEDSIMASSGFSVRPGVPDLVASHCLDASGEFRPYSPEEASSDAYSWNGGSRSVLSLAVNIREIPPHMPRTADDPVWVEGYCGLIGLYDIMAVTAMEQGFAERPRLADDIRRAREEVLLETWHETVVMPRVSITGPELLEAWERNREMLLVPERRVFRMIAAGPDRAGWLAGLVAAGEDPFLRTDSLQEVTSFLDPSSDGLTVPLAEGDLPAFAAREAFEAPAGTPVLATAPSGGALYLVTVEVVPGREATFEEARPSLEGLLLEQRAEEVLSGLVDSLVSSYSWSIDQDFLDRFRIRAPSPGGE
jgi:hypothetical protein